MLTADSIPDRPIFKYSEDGVTNTHIFPLAVFAFGKQIATLQPGETMTFRPVWDDPIKPSEISLIWMEY